MSLPKCEAQSDNSKGGRNINLSTRFPQAQHSSVLFPSVYFLFSHFQENEGYQNDCYYPQHLVTEKEQGCACVYSHREAVLEPFPSPLQLSREGSADNSCLPKNRSPYYPNVLLKESFAEAFKRKYNDLERVTGLLTLLCGLTLNYMNISGLSERLWNQGR